MLAILVYVISVSGFPSLMAVETSPCPTGAFQDGKGACKPCSECTKPKIVLETCWEGSDTVCGTFSGLPPFSFKNSNSVNVVQNDVSTRRNTLEHRHAKPEVASDVDDEWHTITMVTIAVLTVSAVLFSAFIIVTCYKCRRQYKEGLITQVDRDSDFEKVEAEVRHPLPGTSGNTTASSSIDTSLNTSFRSIEQFEIVVEPSPK